MQKKGQMHANEPCCTDNCEMVLYIVHCTVVPYATQKYSKHLCSLVTDVIKLLLQLFRLMQLIYCRWHIELVDFATRNKLIKSGLDFRSKAKNRSEFI